MIAENSTKTMNPGTLLGTSKLNPDRIFAMEPLPNFVSMDTLALSVPFVCGLAWEVTEEELSALDVPSWHHLSDMVRDWRKGVYSGDMQGLNERFRQDKDRNWEDYAYEVPKVTKRSWLAHVRGEAQDSKGAAIKFGLLADCLHGIWGLPKTGFSEHMRYTMPDKLGDVLWTRSLWDRNAAPVPTNTLETINEGGGARSWLLVSFSTDNNQSDYAESAMHKSNEKQIMEALEAQCVWAEEDSRLAVKAFWHAHEQYVLVPATFAMIKAIQELNGTLAEYPYLDDEEANKFERQAREENGEVEICARLEVKSDLQNVRQILEPCDNPEWIDRYDFQALVPCDSDPINGAEVCPECRTEEHLSLWLDPNCSDHPWLNVARRGVDLLLCGGCGGLWTCDSPNVDLVHMREHLAILGYYSPVEGPPDMDINPKNGDVRIHFPDLPMLYGNRLAQGYVWEQPCELKDL